MFTVAVVDSATGEPAWWGARGRIADRTFEEDLVAPSSNPADSTLALSLISRSNREGAYTVTIEKPGYATWVMDGLVVRREACSLTSYSLEARLQRSP